MRKEKYDFSFSSIITNLFIILFKNHFKTIIAQARTLHWSLSFLLFFDKIPDKRDIRKEGLILAHSSRVQSVMAERLWCQEPEAAGHIVPTVRQQEIWTNAALPLNNLSPFCCV